MSLVLTTHACECMFKEWPNAYTTSNKILYLHFRSKHLMNL